MALVKISREEAIGKLRDLIIDRNMSVQYLNKKKLDDMTNEELQEDINAIADGIAYNVCDYMQLNQEITGNTTIDNLIEMLDKKVEVLNKQYDNDGHGGVMNSPAYAHLSHLEGVYKMIREASKVDIKFFGSNVR